MRVAREDFVLRDCILRHAKKDYRSTLAVPPLTGYKTLPEAVGRMTNGFVERLWPGEIGYPSSSGASIAETISIRQIAVPHRNKSLQAPA